MNEDNLSTMMRHYIKLKRKYEDAIVLYRLGDFYEMFFNDAIIASKVLEIQLTGRDCGLKEKAPMCGVPHHAVDIYINKLVEKGYKVAVCEQLNTAEEAKAQKTIVKRDVVRVITPGTLTEEFISNKTKNNYLASIYCESKGFGISWADISTGDFFTFESDGNLDTLEDMLTTIDPAEIITNDASIAKDIISCKLGKLPPFQQYLNWAFDYQFANEILLKQLKTKTLAAFECENLKKCICSAGALMQYLEETQKRYLMIIDSIKVIRNSDYMFIDKNTRRNLEITETMRDKNKKGSLLGVLDKTNTCMGARTIRLWLDQPLQKQNEIEKRLDCVDELLNIPEMRRDIISDLVQIKDIERLCGRIAYGNVTPKDCIDLLYSLSVTPRIKNYCLNAQSELLKVFGKNISPEEHLVRKIFETISEKPPINYKEGGFIKEGCNEELDKLKSAIKNANSWLAQIEESEKEKTGIKTLKVKYNKVIGYYIEIPKSQNSKIPFNYIRKQTTINGERYITAELKDLEDTLLGAQEKSIELELAIFSDLKTTLLEKIKSLKLTAKAIGCIDVLVTFAEISNANHYVRPKINTQNIIEIKNGRHPVIEEFLSASEFITNDTFLNNTDCRTMILTGPNMSGKSTYMRQVAIITLMAHIGCFVAADEASISITDRIFTRVGASDDVAAGISTFMMEMIEVGVIINNATQKSLIIMDEIGRGTSTYDGLSIAWSVIEYVNDQIKAKTLFATHYHELTQLEGKMDGIKNYRILVNEINNGVIFLHKIARGGANKSFGIEVASIAGIPRLITNRARDIVSVLESKEVQNISIETKEPSPKEIELKDNEIIESLKSLNIDNYTPLQALTYLNDLIQKVKEV